MIQAQSQAAVRLEFEVASISPNKANSPGFVRSPQGWGQ